MAQQSSGNRTQIWVAVIGTVGVVVAAIIARNSGSSPPVAGTKEQSASASTTPPTHPSGSISVSALAQASFMTPANNATFSRLGTVKASGTVRNLKENESLWLFDSDEQTYTVDQQARIIGSRWSAISVGPFGDPDSTLPFTMSIMVIVASPLCDQALQAKSTAADSTMASLPLGCRVTDSRTIEITH